MVSLSLRYLNRPTSTHRSKGIFSLAHRAPTGHSTSATRELAAVLLFRQSSFEMPSPTFHVSSICMGPTNLEQSNFQDSIRSKQKEPGSDSCSPYHIVPLRRMISKRDREVEYRKSRIIILHPELSESLTCEFLFTNRWAYLTSRIFASDAFVGQSTPSDTPGESLRIVRVFELADIERKLPTDQP